jgi:hypothetical protein
MFTELAHSVVGARAVQAERLRILSTLLGGMEALADRAVDAMRAEIPSYAAQDERFFADVRDQVSKHYRTKLHCLLEERAVTLEDIAFVRGAAMRRARAGFALADYINAFRVGQQVFWEAVVACAGRTPVGHEAALTLAAPLMSYCNFASTHAGHAYVEFQQYLVADADRERRDLLEQLLTGEPPTCGPLLAAARGYGLGAATPMMVAVAVPVGPQVDPQVDADASHAASAAIMRAGLGEPRTLVVVRQAEIVAVPVLRARSDAAALCERLEAVRERLGKEGMPLAMGISTAADSVAELPRAYLEARTALESVEGDGMVALPRLSAFEYLARRADDTARRLVEPRLRLFLDDDRARGGALATTIRAFAAADLNLRLAAERLQVHPNTAHYRLRRVEQRTGRNPRRISDLIDLLIAMALQDDTALSS